MAPGVSARERAPAGDAAVRRTLGRTWRRECPLVSARTRVMLLFGGRSAEHDVSRVTAVAVARALDPDRYEVVPVAITTDGRWLLADEARELIARDPAALPPALDVTGSELMQLGGAVATPGSDD